jgi:hypothetical protein
MLHALDDGHTLQNIVRYCFLFSVNKKTFNLLLYLSRRHNIGWPGNFPAKLNTTREQLRVLRAIQVH